MQHAVSSTQQHAVAVQRRDPRPGLLAVDRKVFSASNMDEPEHAVMVVNHRLVAVEPSDQTANGCTGDA